MIGKSPNLQKNVEYQKKNKELKLKDKLPTMSEEEQLQLLSTNGMLIKRPVIVTEDIVLTGFREREWEEKLLHDGVQEADI